MTTETSRHVRPACLLLTALLASCYSTATLHTARPIAPGAVQSAAAVGVYVEDDGDGDGDREVYRLLEGQIRVGLSERVDAGTHLLGFGGLGLDLNLALLLTETQAVSIDPTIEYSIGATYAWLPVLWDFFHTEDLTLTASLRGGRYWLNIDGDDDGFLFNDIEEDAWLYGGGLAARVQLTDSMAIAPEVRVTWFDPGGGDASVPIWSVSLGLIF
jgi:hypothetical protein